jgi:hypothetical protein
LRSVDPLRAVDRVAARLEENMRREPLELGARDDLPELLGNVLVLQGTPSAGGKYEFMLAARCPPT